MIRAIRRHVGALLDAVVWRYIPDCKPVIFDSERSARWREMVETAERITSIPVR